jgi:decaprenylphospho-beta-D-erythro-pentofuranosid-2-ulose 2-reductase
MNHYVIFGGSSAIAEQCARQWVQEKNTKITLVVRDKEKGERIADDLSIRSAADCSFEVELLDFLCCESINNLIHKVSNKNPIDVVLIAHGSLPTPNDYTYTLEACKETISINGISPILIAEACVKLFEAQGHGKIGIIGSVAGDRGRKSNYLYGAAKGMLWRYTQGLQHRLHGTNIKVTFIKPGPTKTPMAITAAGKTVELAPVDLVAKSIVDGMKNNRRCIYTPKKWIAIMFIIKHIPSRIFNNLSI